MFKQAVFVVLETLLFLLVFLAFSVILPGLGRIPVWRIHVSAVRDFNPTGIAAMLAVLVVFLAIEAARKRLRPAGSLTVLSFVLALCLGLASKFGFIGLN